MSNTNIGVLHSTKPGCGSQVDSHVDSDRDGSRGPGSSNKSDLSDTGTVSGYGDDTAAFGNGGDTGLTGTSASGHTEAGTTASSTTSGPHSPDLSKIVDPRNDSDRDGSHSTGSCTGSGMGFGMGSGATGTAGPNISNLGNQANSTPTS